MPFVAFHLRMQAAAARKLNLIAAFRAADGGPSVQEYLDSLHRAACLHPSKPVFALIQSEIA